MKKLIMTAAILSASVCYGQDHRTFKLSSQTDSLMASQTQPEQAVYSGWADGNEISLTLAKGKATGYIGLNKVTFSYRDGIISGSFQDDTISLHLEGTDLVGQIGETQVSMTCASIAPMVSE